MSNQNRQSLSRRQLLGASAGMAALSLLPAGVLARSRAVEQDGGLQSWLKRISPATAPHDAVGPQCWVIRHLGGHAPLSLALVYRALPQQPFELFRGDGRLAPSGISVATEAGAIDGLAIQRLDSPDAGCETCSFNGWLQPGLAVGHYAILINSGQRRWRPDWSVAALDSGQGVVATQARSDPLWQDYTLLSLDVRAA